jgi:macrodomain Ter protein organizer (MatP/YcbG family)
MAKTKIDSLPARKNKPQRKTTAKDSTARNNKTRRKSVALPAYLWEILMETAEHQRRTFNKQIEVILVDHFGLDSPIEAPNRAEIEDESSTNTRKAS